MQRRRTGYFLPDDWILWQSEGLLEATKLSSGEQVRIETDLAGSDAFLSASVWSTLARFEPLIGQLRELLEKRSPEPLTRDRVLRGSGWKQLFIELTARCNEQCVHCYAESSPLRSETLEWAEIRAALEDARGLGFDLVQLTGGDPLLSPHCVRAAEHAREVGIPRVEIYTNGLALRGKTYERLRGLRASFAFSFYSHDPETHDGITHTPGSQARTARAIRRAVDDGLEVRVGVIVMMQNQHHVTKTLDYLRGLGVRESAIRFDRMRDVGRGQPMRWEAEAGFSISGLQSERPRTFGGSAAVSYDGMVYPCIFSRHRPLGSIHDASLRAILTSAELIKAPKKSLLVTHDDWGDKLSCWECRARSALLEGSCHA